MDAKVYCIRRKCQLCLLVLNMIEWLHIAVNEVINQCFIAKSQGSSQLSLHTIWNAERKILDINIVLLFFFSSTFSHSYLWWYKRRNRQHERRRLRDTRDEAGSQSGTEWVSSSPPKAHQWINLQYALRESSRQNSINVVSIPAHTRSHNWSNWTMHQNVLGVSHLFLFFFAFIAAYGLPPKPKPDPGRPNSRTPGNNQK